MSSTIATTSMVSTVRLMRRSKHPCRREAPRGGTMTTLGERFADAIAQRDPGAMTALIADEVDFRGMTPRKVWEATDADGVIDAVLGHWFEEADLISSAVRAESDAVSDTCHVSYRFEIDNED